MRTRLLGPSLALALAACSLAPPEPTVGLSPEAPTTLDDLVVAITDSPELEADEPVYYDITWFRSGEEVTDLSGAATVPADRTAKGQGWRVVVIAVDEKARFSRAIEAEVTIGNAAPVATVTIAPGDPQTGDDLVATVVGEDPDGDAMTYTWSWLRNGTDAGITSDTVPAGSTSKGEVWEVAVIPADAEASGDAARAQVTVGNSAPSAATVALEPTEAYEGSLITALPTGSDVDGDTLTWRYEWFVDDVVVPEVSGDKLDGSAFDKGARVRAAATPSDGQIEGNTVQSDEIVVLNSLPAVEKATVTPDPVTKSSEVTCSPTGWSDADSDPEGYRTRWDVNGRAGISTEAVLTGERFSKGDTIVCVLTPWDGEGEGVPVTSEAVIVGNTAPSLASVTLSTTTPGTNDTVTATAAGVADLDGDSVMLTFAWSVNGSVVSTDRTTGLSSPLSGVSHFGRGDRISVTVTPNDGDDDGTAVTSATATVVNSPPTAPTVAIEPSAPRETDNLGCKVKTAATDPDGDRITYDVDWYRNGTLWTGSTTTTTLAGDTIPSSQTGSGQKWECYVTAYDGMDYGPDGKSGQVTVSAGFTPPRVGTTGSYGVISGDGWRVCRADTSSTWIAANRGGTYNVTAICTYLGYTSPTAKGGTCGTVCGYCGSYGREYYDGGGGSYSSLRYTVHWRCSR